MRSVLGFFSLLAFGFLTAGLLAVLITGADPQLPFAASSGQNFQFEAPLGLDLTSLLLGLAAGIILSSLAHISWAELPRRTVHWLLVNERNFVRLAWVALFAAILLFY